MEEILVYLKKDGEIVLEGKEIKRVKTGEKTEIRNITIQGLTSIIEVKTEYYDVDFETHDKVYKLELLIERGFNNKIISKKYWM